MNTIGSGPFSSIIKCQTKSLPPDPPRLECIGITCNSIKLKWGNGTVNHTFSPTTESSTTNTPRSMTYIIEMEGRDGRFVQKTSLANLSKIISPSFSFHCIYTGTTYSHKINKLQENTPYSFRICAKNDSGAGPWSDMCTFTTSKAPPNALKG